MATGTREAFRGCLLGGAVGDALGAPVEFMDRGEILAQYGEAGIRDMDVAYGVRGAITDDTQMTLFTAEALIRADIRAGLRGIGEPYGVALYAYQRWLATQGETADPHALEPDNQGWLFPLKALHARRAPGNTCLQALRSAARTRKIEADNNSKGCGGVMRVAPIGLVARDPYELGCGFAHTTHGHPLGIVSSGAMALLIHLLKEGLGKVDAVSQVVERGEDTPELAAILRRAVILAATDRPAPECIGILGGGWVAEEALAISVYCFLRAETFEEGVIIAVNHSGDSDSTGSMVGQLFGVLLGESAIPPQWREEVELADVVLRIADDLYGWFVEGRWEQRGGDPEVPEEWWRRYPGG